MADSGSGSNRDGRAGRVRVQQLRPTNKDASGGTGLPGFQRPTVTPAASTSATASTSETPAVPAGNAATIAAAPRVIPRIVTGQGGGSTIIVNSLQRGNPLLKHIKNVAWEYGDIVPDYQVGVQNCVLFLSLKYHRLHPEYIDKRISNLGQMFSLRILLVICDVDQHQSAIKELTKVALVNNLTMMLAWSSEEAGTYLERYKTFERAPPDLIRERVNDDYMSHLTSALTSIRGVNKTDVITLATQFGSLKRIAQATGDELADCPGFGETKIRRFQEAFRQPFRVGETRTRHERMAANRDKEQGASSGSRSAAVGPLRPRVATNGSGQDPDEDEEAAAVDSVQETASTLANAPPIAGTAAPPVPGGGPATLTDEDISNKQSASDLPDDIEDDDDGWGDVLDNMTEEERLQLAMEMSISNGEPAA